MKVGLFENWVRHRCVQGGIQIRTWAGGYGFRMFDSRFGQGTDVKWSSLSGRRSVLGEGERRSRSDQIRFSDRNLEGWDCADHVTPILLLAEFFLCSLPNGRGVSLDSPLSALPDPRLRAVFQRPVGGGAAFPPIHQIPFSRE